MNPASLAGSVRSCWAQCKMVFDSDSNRFGTAIQMAIQFLYHFYIGESQIYQSDSDKKQWQDPQKEHWLAHMPLLPGQLWDHLVPRDLEKPLDHHTWTDRICWPIAAAGHCHSPKVLPLPRTKLHLIKLCVTSASSMGVLSWANWLCWQSILK